MNLKKSNPKLKNGKKQECHIYTCLPQSKCACLNACHPLREGLSSIVQLSTIKGLTFKLERNIGFSHNKQSTHLF